MLIRCLSVLACEPEHRGEGALKEAAAAAAAGQAEVERSVQLSCGEHTDYGLLTFVNQEPHMTALQVRGVWPGARWPRKATCAVDEEQPPRAAKTRAQPS
jgi:hypothetical protein